MKKNFKTDFVNVNKYYFMGLCYLEKHWGKDYRKTKILGITTSHPRIKNDEIYDTLDLKNFFEKNTKNRIIDIIVPIFNGAEHLEPLFESVISNTDLDYKIFLIDDKSTDSNVDKILTKWAHKFGEKVLLLRNNENLGFVKTVNKALSQTTNDVVILNTDVRVPKNWASRLMQPIFENDNVASVTPFSNAATIFSFPQQWENNDLEVPLQEIDNIFYSLNYDNKIIQKLCFPTGVGFCMAMSRKAINKIGFLDEAFGRGYGEENDWCMKAVKAGFINTLAYNLFVYHKHGGTFLSEEKKKLCEKHAKIIKKRYPEYEKYVQESAETDTYKIIRFLLLLKYFNKIAKETVLYIDHSLGGGTETYFYNQVKAKKDTQLILRMQFDKSLSFYRVTMFYKDKVIKIIEKSLDQVVILLNNLKLNEIIINNLVGYDNSLEILNKIKTLKKSETKISMRGHDFQSICPFFTLIDYEGKFCNIPRLDFCKKCFLKNSLSDDKNYNDILMSGAKDIKTWRQEWNKFFTNYLDEFVVFSECIKKLFIKAYPCLKNKIKVIPHYVEPLNKANIKPSKNIRIGILGNINSVSKGLNIVKKMNNLKNKYNVSIEVIGTIPKKYKIPYTGIYKREDLPKILEKNNINIIFIPSIWPETFSYTTSEAIMMDVPVACFNLGAPAERVSKYKKGLVINKIDAEYALKEIIKYIQNTCL